MSILDKMLKKESLDNYIDADSRLIKSMSAWDLVALGIGAVIGTGIFILPGTVAATKSGPAIILSFVVAAIVCGLAAMCYAEFSSALPIAGSAYSYGNVVYGQFIGWILGWALVLEYMLSVAAVSTGWAAYFNSLISGFGIHMPTALSGAFDPAHGTYINLVAVLIVLFVAWLLSNGMKTSTRVQNIMVAVKIVIILIFVLVGLFYVKPANWHPFFPYKGGVLAGASAVFFAFLGFDVVAASAAEVKNPKRNMPIGIIGTLIVASILYIAVSVVLTGLVSYKRLNVADPVAFALQQVGQNWGAALVSIGALAGMFTMMLAMIYSSSRLVYSIGRDGLLPKWLGNVNKKSGNPTASLTTVTVLIAIMAGLVPLEQLTNLVNIGTLIAFTFVSFGVIPLRRRKDINHTDGFRVPWYPVLPIISGLACMLLLFRLPLETWVASLIWFAFGMLIYFGYGIRHSKLVNN
ncbi:MAG: amino acid permease [Furfurilactobacillus sp.]|jgi:APA family basic amino acid/polyamine antiporter|uniref:Amino acid permease n=1 Tax=Furfurilactobacillus milii TaxID=2888272 RepID=A0ABT6DBQ3_9LACO|nr:MULTISPECIES: amino acid permease [Furfurilactobacillus]QLE67242.1 Amino acid transporter [Furfurilactobacillus rossiae]MCF6161067.1 amino acid permease [Furfurilactobacillus milii]MCF6163443.1 amino acid permease [Furfurilactobacillus milii]MCF6418755.1 amino acid permease [Furfurilactobacillus milii]MCH4011433.1 amino acid permease [Furfurilactobacillus sp.]